MLAGRANRVLAGPSFVCGYGTLVDKQIDRKLDVHRHNEAIERTQQLDWAGGSLKKSDGLSAPAIIIQFNQVPQAERDSAAPAYLPHGR